MTGQQRKIIHIGFGNFAEEKRFVARKGKMPINPVTGKCAKANDPDTWGTFNQAIEAMSTFERNGVDGIGVQLGEGLCGIDIDHCINEHGQISEKALDIIMTMKSYTEKSVSGTGVHILYKGTLPDGARRLDDLEMYSEGRYFVLTGDIYEFQCG
jgi:putative DNA primase/helicase